jgi:hypothetical protein
MRARVRAGGKGGEHLATALAMAAAAVLLGGGVVLQPRLVASHQVAEILCVALH